MNRLQIFNFKLVGGSDPDMPWALFDVDLGNGSIARNVSILDNGVVIRLSGIEASPDLREEIIAAAMKEAQRLR